MNKNNYYTYRLYKCAETVDMMLDPDTGKPVARTEYPRYEVVQPEEVEVAATEEAPSVTPVTFKTPPKQEIIYDEPKLVEVNDKPYESPKANEVAKTNKENAKEQMEKVVMTERTRNSKEIAEKANEINAYRRIALRNALIGAAIGSGVGGILGGVGGTKREALSIGGLGAMFGGGLGYGGTYAYRALKNSPFVKYLTGGWY